MLETVTGVALTAAIGAVGFVMHLGTRITVLESKVEAFEKWLDKIEEKLDHALQK